MQGPKLHFAIGEAHAANALAAARLTHGDSPQVQVEAAPQGIAVPDRYVFAARGTEQDGVKGSEIHGLASWGCAQSQAGSFAHPGAKESSTACAVVNR